IVGVLRIIMMDVSVLFLPVGCMDGPAGIFYRQFAYTLATAILISALNALTLSPALCALLLKAPQDEKEIGKKKNKFNTYKDKFFTAFNTSFDRFTDKYIIGVKKLIRSEERRVGKECRCR